MIVRHRNNQSSAPGRRRLACSFFLVYSKEKLHFLDVDALVRTYFDTAHATDAFPCLVGICFAICSHLINLYGTDVDAFSAASAAIEVYID